MNDVEVKRMSTAMTNLVFEVTSTLQSLSINYEDSESTAGQPEKLLVRIYCGNGWMFSRELEEKVALTLMRDRVCPRWFGVFKNGRIEEFLPSSPVSSEQFRQPKVLASLLRKLALVHGMAEKVIPYYGGEVQDLILSRLENWFRRSLNALPILKVKYSQSHLAPRLDRVSALLKCADFQEIKRRLHSVGSPMVFGHCDVRLTGVLRVVGFIYWVVTSWECPVRLDDQIIHVNRF